QNRLLAQVKSSRSINRFRILHGRLFSKCAEFPLLRNRGLGLVAVTVLPIALARRPAAAAQSTAPLLVARLSPRTAVPMVFFGGNRRVGLTSGLVDLDARGRSPHVRSRRQPTVRPRSRGSLPRLPYAASVGGPGVNARPGASRPIGDFPSPPILGSGQAHSVT